MDVISERRGAVMICTINRPQAGNSITAGVFSGLLEAYREADRDDGVRVIVTRGAGADAAQLADWIGKPLHECFAEAYEGRQGLDSLGETDARALDRLGMNRWAEAVFEIGVPMIAQIRGVAAGGGLGIALLHHFRFADASARLTTAFGRLGLGTELGVAYLLQRAVGRQVSLDLTLSSRVVAAEEAATLGLVDRVVAADALEAETMRHAEQIAALPPLSARAMVEAHRAPYRQALRAALELEWQQQQVLWNSEAFCQGVRALMQRRGK
jgi:enoyl-CoA hydratase